MIPRIIHYCWFGGTPLPKSARRCIASWRKFLPDYEIREWNESNVDVNSLPYMAEAYAAKKYAFVSDVVRFQAMYEQGGLYFDTDVEVIRPLDDVLARGPFFAMEARTHPRQQDYYVAPGLGCACEAGNPIWRDILEVYRSFPHFDFASQGTVCTIVTDVLSRQGIRLQGELLHSQHVTIYPPDWFCPQAMAGAPVRLTENTRSIHRYDCTWLPRSTRLRLKLMGMLPHGLQQTLRQLIHRS